MTCFSKSIVSIDSPLWTADSIAFSVSFAESVVIGDANNGGGGGSPGSGITTGAIFVIGYNISLPVDTSIPPSALNLINEGKDSAGVCNVYTPSPPVKPDSIVEPSTKLITYTVAPLIAPWANAVVINVPSFGSHVSVHNICWSFIYSLCSDDFFGNTSLCIYLLWVKFVNILLELLLTCLLPLKENSFELPDKLVFCRVFAFNAAMDIILNG